MKEALWQRKKIDPLNKKPTARFRLRSQLQIYLPQSAFYQNAFGFSKRGLMNGHDGKPMHAELTLRANSEALVQRMLRWEGRVG